MKNIQFNRYHKEVKNILSQTTITGAVGSSAANRLETYCKVIRHNQFITVLDIENYDFTFKYGIEKVLGYSDSEFTARSLIGYTNTDKETHPIIHPDDVSWYLHYGVLLYKFLSNAHTTINFDTDYAWFRFRVKSWSGDFFMAEYITLLHEATPEGQILSHLDIWTILPIENTDTFVPDFGFYSRNNFEEHKLIFHEINEDILGIKFTDREIEVAKKIAMGYTRKEVADMLSVAVGSINTHVTNMKGKINHYLLQTPKPKSISNITELLRFATAYKLLR